MYFCSFSAFLILSPYPASVPSSNYLYLSLFLFPHSFSSSIRSSSTFHIPFNPSLSVLLRYVLIPFYFTFYSFLLLLLSSSISYNHSIP
jgi:hypothetical protein